MITLYHRGGPAPCFKPAITVKFLPGRYEMPAENVVLLDGTMPQRGDAMICGSCGGPITPQWLYETPYPAEFRGLVFTPHERSISVSF